VAKTRPDLPALSAAQQEIMQLVWERGEVSVREVREILSERREVARNTVRTLLERMREKGWLKHQVKGRTYVYSAAFQREATAGQKVVEVLDQICGGSPEALMSALIDYRGLTADELQRIRTMLDDADSESTSKQGGK
jgi:BlaI family transcriptional regulator, penicillinase repressor